MKTLLLIFCLLHISSSSLIREEDSSRNTSGEPFTTLSLKGAKFLNSMRVLPLNVQFRAIQGDLSLRPNNDSDPLALLRSVNPFRGGGGTSWNSLMMPSSQMEPKLAEPAYCATEESTVDLDIPQRDPGSFYYPSCVRVKRCSGCCSHGLLSCQPMETEVINTTIMKADQRTNQILYLSVPVEQHKRCACSCTVKEKDCTPNQVYKEADCRCTCNNTELEKIECISSGNRIWNPQLCYCQCLRMFECTTGQFFDPRTCNCRDHHH